MRKILIALLFVAPLLQAQTADPIIRESCVAWIYNTNIETSDVEVFVIESGGEWEWIVRPSVVLMCDPPEPEPVIDPASEPVVVL